jgi:hypothetical protein
MNKSGKHKSGKYSSLLWQFKAIGGVFNFDKMGEVGNEKGYNSEMSHYFSIYFDFSSPVQYMIILEQNLGNLITSCSDYANGGNNARVFVHKTWAGERVQVIRFEPIDEEGK